MTVEGIFWECEIGGGIGFEDCSGDEARKFGRGSKLWTASITYMQQEGDGKP